MRSPQTYRAILPRARTRSRDPHRPALRVIHSGISPFAAVSPRPLAEEPPARARLQLLVSEAVQRKWVLAAVAAIVASVGIGAAELRGTPTAVESFWSPVWGSTDSVMMAIGAPPIAAPQPAAAAGVEVGPTFREVMKYDGMAFSDALTMARITGLSREYAKKKLDIRRATAFTLTDFRKGPVILVGAFNNSWTMRLDTGNCALHTKRTARAQVCRDRQNPSNNGWVHDPAIPYSNVSQDYAVVSRFLDPLTEKMVVVVGGMGRDGTIAAGEFVTKLVTWKCWRAAPPRIGTGRISRWCWLPISSRATRVRRAFWLLTFGNRSTPAESVNKSYYHGCTSGTVPWARSAA